MGAIELIKSDLFRYAGTTSSKEFIKTYVKEAGFRFSVAFRLVSAGGALKLLGAILRKYDYYSLQIHCNMLIKLIEGCLAQFQVLKLEF